MSAVTVRRSVGIVCDDSFQHHLTGPNHVESPQRTRVIVNALVEARYLTTENTLKPRYATIKELELAHSITYIQKVQREVSECPLDTGEVTLSNDADTHISPQSFSIATLAAGAVLTAVDAVFNKQFSRVFCVVRPPGHHANATTGSGFCLFNNVAIGALYAIKTYNLQKVMIIDWDVHHGNGTEDIVRGNAKIHYVSTHQHNLYPYTGEESRNNATNNPIEGGDQSRQDVLNFFKTTLVQLMHDVKPDVIFISAGFDGHIDDPLGNFNLTETDFAEMTRIIKENAPKCTKDRIISVLEGGYNLAALQKCSKEHVRALS